MKIAKRITTLALTATAALAVTLGAAGSATAAGVGGEYYKESDCWAAAIQDYADHPDHHNQTCLIGENGQGTPVWILFWD
ncbi:hypothetical protein EES40_36440 [Streptomyces sp. ADI93-02]|nr:hypothetical protein EES40_36440 [Streptomyces sp. ADI93-02]